MFSTNSDGCTARSLRAVPQCRMNKRRVKLCEVLLESVAHAESSFWTLTYSDECLNLTASGRPTLRRKHVQNFLKLLRKHLATLGLKVKHYSVGEYGTLTERPHYHLILFGYPACRNLQTVRDFRGQPDAEHCCEWCRLVQKFWVQCVLL